MKCVLIPLGVGSVVPLQFCQNVYAAWPLFSRMATWGLCLYGLQGGHRQAELEFPQLPKVLKILYSEEIILWYISLLEKAVTPSLMPSPVRVQILPLFYLLPYLDSTCTARALLRQTLSPMRPPSSPPSIQRAFHGASAGAEDSQSTCSVYKPRVDHPD